MSDRFTESSVFLGGRLYDAANIGGSPVATFLGYFGGMYHLAQTGQTLWASLYGAGIRPLPDGVGALAWSRSSPTFGDDYLDIFTLPGTSDAFLSIRDRGIDRVALDHLLEPEHQRAVIRRGHEGTAFNGADLLAVPRSGWGVDLVRISAAAGPPVTVATVAGDAIDAVAVTWLYSDTLVVADSYRNLKFYRVQANYSAVLVGSWRPAGALPPSFRSLAATAGGRMAVGLHDGRVLVLDTSQTTLKTAATEWQLLE
jgi:hypothetical protein